ncbi:hypothetical protein SAMN06297229_0245 [Pseudidiomarina planktonica]|uniref:ABC-2 family transporter protein n=1 Tax=Pseudidiomarina planktonica TaxID=1323738 RepID=A0A1Y6E9N0_9GAMM|nr:hypothetical protein [Pseudidiomarina planktonica]RUO66260.1 hypothetical protein CWI77_07520 [Pseudidiomarina planktonica]SMQ59304.1 hypothetical protein SAMN06297229_0245 [Pseudidiomarina planktonica]
MLNKIKNEALFFLQELNAKKIEVLFGTIFLCAIFVGIFWFTDKEQSKITQYLPYYMLWVLLSGVISHVISSIKNDTDNKMLGVLTTSFYSYKKTLAARVLVRIPYDILLFLIYFFVLKFMFDLSQANTGMIIDIIIYYVILIPVVVCISISIGSALFFVKQHELVSIISSIMVALLLYLAYAYEAFFVISEGFSSTTAIYLAIYSLLFTALSAIGFKTFDYTLYRKKRTGGV